MKETKTTLNILFGEAAARAYDEFNTDESPELEREIERASGGCYAYHELEFATQAEKEAYLKGIEDSQGWEDYVVLPDGKTLKLEKS